MTQSEIFSKDEADKYIERNIKKSHSYAIEYLFNIIDKNELANIDVAEFGIGPGYNLHLLSHYVNKVHGYDVSRKAIKYFMEGVHPEKKDKFASKCVNLTKPFTSLTKYDLIIWGFFAYYVDNNEIQQVKKNTVNALKKSSYVFINDFLVRNTLNKADKRNKNLNVYKRNFNFWIDLFDVFDLIDFRLFDCKHKKDYLMSHQQCIDFNLDNDDQQWEFCALFKKRI